jgi:type II secretory pathway component PulK
LQIDDAGLMISYGAIARRLAMAGANPCRATRTPFRQRLMRRHRVAGGMVLVLVLVVVAMLTLAALSFSQRMLSERQGAKLAGQQSQAQALSDSGVEMARLFLSQEEQDQEEAGSWYDNPDRFRARLVIDDPQAKGRGRFSIVAPAIQDDGLRSGIRFGLEDESTRLNLNAVLLADSPAASVASTASAASAASAATTASTTSEESEESEDSEQSGARGVLMKLPGMTEEIADSILDWIDPDDEPREFGAESEYYSQLDPPYAPKNGPLETIEELLLVRGVTPWLLFGADANHNGVVDRDEPSADSIDGVDNTDGAMDSGWAAYLTLYSLELNVRPDGRPRVYLNQESMETLYNELEEAVGRPWATFIVAYKQSGAYTGSKSGQLMSTGQLDLSKSGKVKLTSVLDLIGSNVQVTFKGEEEPTILETPFPNLLGATGAYLPLLLGQVTTNSSPIIPGRININQASRTVLAGIPGMTDEILQELLSRRTKNPVDRLPNRRFETWILDEGIVTLDEMKGLMPYVTAGGHVFRGQFVGYFDEQGPSARIEAILDATKRPARVLFWRDMSHLGRGYPSETLGIESDE